MINFEMFKLFPRSIIENTSYKTSLLYETQYLKLAGLETFESMINQIYAF